jgi:hypothetical protein
LGEDQGDLRTVWKYRQYVLQKISGNRKDQKGPSGKVSWRREMMEPFDDDYVTRSEVQEMIDAAIRRHNRNASIISMCVGWVVLALFAEGLLRLIGVIPPILPWLNITLK